jgi:hypothetical protein
VAALVCYADQTWTTQLTDLGGPRRVATLLAYTHLHTSSARDDVIDICDMVFGDLQRSATHRGQKRRAGELRDYDFAVGEVVVDVLDAEPVVVTGVLDELRTDREQVEQATDTVATLMRPPGDPFHERLVAAYPQIRRFLPLLIEAIELQATDAAQPVLTAYQALGNWLADKPRHHPPRRRPTTGRDQPGRYCPELSPAVRVNHQMTSTRSPGHVEGIAAAGRVGMAAASAGM